MDPAMIKASMEMAKALSPEQMRQMQQMAAAGGGFGAPGGMAPMPGMPPGLGGMGGPGGLDMGAAASMMDSLSPEMLEGMSKMVGSMEPEAMASMLSSTSGRPVSAADAAAMQAQLKRVSPETMTRWLGRAARGYKMWLWLKASAALLCAEPRRAAAAVLAGSPLGQLCGLLCATLCALIVGHVGSLF